jgi:hypothetical protein
LQLFPSREALSFVTNIHNDQDQDIATTVLGFGMIHLLFHGILDPACEDCSLGTRTRHNVQTKGRLIKKAWHGSKTWQEQEKAWQEQDLARERRGKSKTWQEQDMARARHGNSRTSKTWGKKQNVSSKTRVSRISLWPNFFS